MLIRKMLQVREGSNTLGFVLCSLNSSIAAVLDLDHSVFISHDDQVRMGLENVRDKAADFVDFLR